MASLQGCFLNLLLGNNRMQLKASDDFNSLLCIHYGEQEDQFIDKSLNKEILSLKQINNLDQCLGL